jgi:acyl CoA:acetate/3-ketoacid CoA transferase beta subunit
MGILKKEEDSGELVLKKYLPRPEWVLSDKAVEEIRLNCGWELKISDRLEEVDLPTERELSLARKFMPSRYRRR